MQVEIFAPEFQADTTFKDALYRFEGSTREGWTVLRNGEAHLGLGPGYRLLRTVSCGVCSTDLVRHWLPFPLPQVIGHEVLAEDKAGQRVVVEINASHRALGQDAGCPFCAAGLETHCPDRLTLGIHGLPGGFGPHFLAPASAVIPLPETVPDRAGVLVEPLAAALHAVAVVQPGPGDRVAVLGTRRLGLLIIAAFRAHRVSTGIDFTILALDRQPDLLDLARTFGADSGLEVEGEGSGLLAGLAEVVVDATGNPGALDLALRLARREVHVKSTHGRPAAGLKHLTEMVVDEIGVGPFPRGDDLEQYGLSGGDRPPVVAWLCESEPPVWLTQSASVLRGAAADVLKDLETSPRVHGLPRVDAAVVDSAAGIDRAVRPLTHREVSLVKPRGFVLLAAGAPRDTISSLDRAVLDRDLRITTSRCGDFRAALELLEADPELRRVGERLITHVFPVRRIAEAFETARSPACIKAVVDQLLP